MFLQVFLFLFPLYLAEQKPGICLCPDPRPMAGAGQGSRILEDQSPHQKSMHLFLLGSGPPEGWMHADDLGTGPRGCGFHGVEGKLVSPGILNMWPGGGWDREELVSLYLSACLSVRLPPGPCCLESQTCILSFFIFFCCTSFSVASEVLDPSGISLW